MRTSRKVAAYAGALVVAFGAAFGVGTLTGSPAENEEAPDAHGHDEPSPAETPAPESSAGLPAGLQVSDSGYTLSAVAAPAATGAAGTLSFQVIGPDGAPVTEYTEAHEKDLHLIVVRTDTADYRHVHPTLGGDGTWSIDWQWASAGTYKVFADFTPTALGRGLTLARLVHVAGPAEPARPLAESLEDEVAGYTVSIDGDLTAGQSSEVTVRVERDGQPVTNLQPYLGAYGHLVALREGDLAYLHVHPEGGPGDGVTAAGPDVRFAVQTPTAGTYRLFFDFQVEGVVRTAEFTVAAGGSGAPPSEPAVEPHDDGDHAH